MFCSGKYRLLLLFCLPLLLLSACAMPNDGADGAVASIPDTVVPTAVFPADLQQQNQDAHAAYLPVLQEIISARPEDHFTSADCATLYDLDGNQIQELIVLYEKDIGSEVGLVVYEIWTYDDAQLFLIAEGGLYVPAGAPRGGLNLVNLDDRQYICIWSNSPEGGGPQGNQEMYYLYRVVGHQLVFEHHYTADYFGTDGPNLEVDIAYPAYFSHNGWEITYDEFAPIYRALNHPDQQVIESPLTTEPADADEMQIQNLLLQLQNENTDVL